MPHSNKEQLATTENTNHHSAIEKRIRFKRKTSNYRGNRVAALSLDVEDIKLQSLANNPNALFGISKTGIAYHAARRIDLFFYTLIAYHNTGLLPLKGHTYIQHGKGRSTPEHNITQACHSSLFGAFTDETGAAYPLHNNEKSPKSILTNTHFLSSLNATVELPGYVNQLDNVIENSSREKAITILQEVARGLYDPIEGLNKFFQLLKTILHDIKKALRKKEVPQELQKIAELPPAIKNELMALVEKGSFLLKWDENTLQVENDYIELLLRVPHDEKQLCDKSEFYRHKCHDLSMIRLQKEILGDNVSIDYNKISPALR